MQRILHSDEWRIEGAFEPLIWETGIQAQEDRNHGQHGPAPQVGNLSPSEDEATWVLSSYLISNAIVLPMAGWLSVRFRRKRFPLTCDVLFSLASAMCGAATSMPMLSPYHSGASGGALQPLSQAILMAYIDNFRLLGIITLVCIPGVLLLRKTSKPSSGIPMH